jgi:hypothetical protein
LSDDRPALRAYAIANTKVPGPVCGVCRIPAPVMKLIRDERREFGTPFPVLSGWLRDKKGIRVAAVTLAKHFREHERQG